MKNTLGDMNDRLDIAKEKINEFEGIAVETVQNETQKNDSEIVKQLEVA